MGLRSCKWRFCREGLYAVRWRGGVLGKIERFSELLAVVSDTATLAASSRMQRIASEPDMRRYRAG